MLPVARAAERARPGVRCTFSVNLREADRRRVLLDSATGRAPPALFEMLKAELERFARRRFDRELFEKVVAEYGLPAWGPETLDAVCGPAGQPRTLADEVVVDPSCREPAVPREPDGVLVQLFVAQDIKLDEERCYIEATGPWHRVTWLETTLMQVVYETLFRDSMRKRYGVEPQADGTWDDAAWYPKWLARALVRCTRSVKAANEAGLRGALFTGRRTGGLALMALQSLFVQSEFRSPEASLHLGTSSPTMRYWLLEAGVEPERVPRCAGTHAHELSMVFSALLGEVDDKAGVPLSQAIGHALYFHLSLPQGDVREPARKALFPMLPDTLGTPAFMKTVNGLKIVRGPHAGEPFLSVIGAARQDSGGLDSFRDIMKAFNFEGALMASEIEVPSDLTIAAGLGYTLFGAGGFMGDSEKAWDADGKNISMAVKVLRVHSAGARTASDPVKTGDSSGGSHGEGKFEADGLLTAEQLAALRLRTKRLAAGESALEPDTLQALFEATLNEFLGSA